MTSLRLISVIISTYNWKEALAVCLSSLFVQNDLNFEIIIADDGSLPDTRILVEELAKGSPVPLRYAYHEDRGFRAGAIRNKAVAKSTGEYLIFLDGDCVVLPHFIQRHRWLAQEKFFVPGNRILLNRSFTKTILDQQILLYKQAMHIFIKWRLQGKINRILPLLYWPFDLFRTLKPYNWKGAMSCNLAVWKKDFIAVNGFDQLFEGWGYEDSDLIVRLIHSGVKRKEGRFAVPVLHLWHRQNDRQLQERNYQRLMERLGNKKIIRAEKGLEN